jgi:hypothetical protein
MGGFPGPGDGLIRLREATLAVLLALIFFKATACVHELYRHTNHVNESAVANASDFAAVSTA